MLGLKHFQGKKLMFDLLCKAFYFLSFGMNKLKAGRYKCCEDLFYKSVSVGHTFLLIHVFAKRMAH